MRRWSFPWFGLDTPVASSGHNPFAQMLKALDALSDDQLEAVGATIDWRLPLTSVSLHSREGASVYDEAHLTLVSGLQVLMQEGSPRQRQLWLRPELLQRGLIFSSKHSGYEGTSPDEWRNALALAYGQSDVASARRIMGWMADLQEAFLTYQPNENALLHWGKSPASRTPEALQTLLDMGLDALLSVPDRLPSLLRGPDARAEVCTALLVVHASSLSEEMERLLLERGGQVSQWAVMEAAAAGQVATLDRLMTRAQKQGRWAEVPFTAWLERTVYSREAHSAYGYIAKHLPRMLAAESAHSFWKDPQRTAQCQAATQLTLRLLDPPWPSFDVPAESCVALRQRFMAELVPVRRLLPAVVTQAMATHEPGLLELLLASASGDADWLNGRARGFEWAPEAESSVHMFFQDLLKKLPEDSTFHRPSRLHTLEQWGRGWPALQSWVPTLGTTDAWLEGLALNEGECDAFLRGIAQAQGHALGQAVSEPAPRAAARPRL